jgi:hypothetical protein
VSINRIMVVVPVVAGLFVTGTAVAHMAPFATDVRDSVYGSAYQTCAHNGVHFNKQGHPNCGLHKGWQKGADESNSSKDEGSGSAAHGGRPAHQNHPSHTVHGERGHQGHGASTLRGHTASSHHGRGAYAHHGQHTWRGGGHGNGHSKTHG